MKRIYLLLATVPLLLTVLAYANADLRVPRPSPSPAREGKIVLHTGLTILTDPKSYEARLQISARDLKSLNEALATVQTTNPTMMQRVSQSSSRTIMAALFLFLAVSFAGVWLARGGQRRSHRVAAAVLLVMAVIGAATVITRANAGPPGSYRWRGLPQALSEGRPTSGGVDIEIVPDESGMKLIMPLKKNGSPNDEE